MLISLKPKTLEEINATLPQKGFMLISLEPKTLEEIFATLPQKGFMLISLNPKTLEEINATLRRDSCLYHGELLIVVKCQVNMLLLMR
jgi:hypothetical protein